MSETLSKQRQDMSQTFEDFERIMEDYYQIIPPDINHFDIEKCSHWEFDDVEKCVHFHLLDEWYLQEFIDAVKECPHKFSFKFEEHEDVDMENLIVTVYGKIGGLY